MTEKPIVEVEEIIALIKKSRVFNIVIEGKDDVIAYRHFEDEANEILGVMALTVSAGGRDNVIKIYESLKQSNDLDRCYFICDKDFWVFTGIPNQYQDRRIITTDGYSIENDLFRDYPLTPLLTLQERNTFLSELEYFSRWFAFAAQMKILERDFEPSLHVNQIIEQKLNEGEVNRAIHYDPGVIDIKNLIDGDRQRYLRGKSYLSLYVRQLNSPKRRPKHNNLSLFEHAAAARGNFLMSIQGEFMEKASEEAISLGII